MKPSHHRLIWIGVIVLALEGILAAGLRVVFLEDLAARADPIRTEVLRALGVNDPFSGQRAAEAARVDEKNAAHPWASYLHVIPGALLLGLAPLQFSQRFREANLSRHRWLGRFLLMLALLIGASALLIGIFLPYAGAGETIAISFFAAIFLFALTRAFLAIRHRAVEMHRRWMIRAFAVAYGISTVRFVLIPLDLLLTPLGVAPRLLFVISLWIGWGGSALAAEAWLRREDPSPNMLRQRSIDRDVLA